MDGRSGDLADLSATAAAKSIRSRDISSEDLIAACLARIAERDGDIQAWEYLDPDYALEQARSADQRFAAGDAPGPLHGVPVAIKDIIATADMPTQDGTPIHKGRQPERDAFCVRALREAGAIIIGKSVTTELATLTPGKTRNPHNFEHTPGGSSSGSAAAVASGMTPLALGTQTGGSVVRPASFCGIHGLKPTLGLISRTGVTMQSHTLDTVGVYGKSVRDLALITDVLAASDPGDDVSYPRAPLNLAARLDDAGQSRPRIAFCHTPAWDEAEAGAQAAITELANALGDRCEHVAMAAELDDITPVHHTIMAAENTHHFGPLQDKAGHLLSAALRQRLEAGSAITTRQYLDALSRREPMYRAFANLFERFDAVLCLSSPGPAPKGLGATGNPVFNSMWTYLGVPTVTLPLLEVDGLPLGAQLVGPRRGEVGLLQTAVWLEKAVQELRG